MKNIKIKKKNISKKDKTLFIKNKIMLFQQMITDTIIYVQKYKTREIITINELNICIQSLEHIFDELNKIENIIKNSGQDYEIILNILQKINNDISVTFRSFGTKKLSDLLIVSMGGDFIDNISSTDRTIYNVLNKYIHPVGYKVLNWGNDSDKKKVKIIAKNKIVEDFMIVERAKNYDCFDLARTSQNFQKKVYGIKIAIQNPTEKKTLIVSGLVDDITVNCINDSYIKNKVLLLYKNRPTEHEFNNEDYVRFIDSLTIKEILIYSEQELFQKYIGYLNQTLLMKQKSISQNVREFVNSNFSDKEKY